MKKKSREKKEKTEELEEMIKADKKPWVKREGKTEMG